MRLFREVVLDCWKDRQVGAMRLRTAAERRMATLGQKLERLNEAFIYRQAVDQTTYDEQRDKLREELALAELELHEMRLEELDIEGVLGLAEHLLTNAARLWTEASLEQKQHSNKSSSPRGSSSTVRDLEPPQPAWLSSSWGQARL